MESVLGSILIVCSSLSLVTNTIAQVGAVDPTFDPGFGANGAVFGLGVQPDGRIIVVGTFTAFNGTARNGIVRLNADGAVDQSFNPTTDAGGIFSVAFRKGVGSEYCHIFLPHFRLYPPQSRAA